MQAASAVVDRVLALTWASSHGPTQWNLFLSDFTGHGLPAGVVTVTEWILPLLWTVGFFALLHDRRRLARASVLIAALPTLWPLLAPLVTTSVAPEPLFATASALLAWLAALALCVAHHRDAPQASLPFGSPGIVFMACCVVMGASAVLPMAADAVWAPATCFALGALGWLLWRARRTDHGTAGGGVALAVLGLLLLAVRVAALYPWLDVPMPAVVLGGALGQVGVLALLVVALAVVGGRDLATR
ncbi:hypothetical protein [Streptomyces montanus]|uniref:hypothetical protein n=1 Tax=Streptomyces montanus TaxID=2580423 RepID=UPI001FEA69F8|nr:hypothetical protein [Streptomyces montanus]